MKIFVFLMIVSVSVVCYAAPQYGSTPYQQQSVDDSTSQNLPVACDSYDSCIDLGLKERKTRVNSVLLYFSDSAKEGKYGLYNNIYVKLNGNTCPPILNVYKTVNNINYMMDVFTGSRVNSCIKYYANITGDNRNRDVIVKQLEITYCNVDELFENCQNGIVYTKINDFGTGKEAKETTPKQLNVNEQYNSFPDYNQSTERTVPLNNIGTGSIWQQK